MLPQEDVQRIAKEVYNLLEPTFRKLLAEGIEREVNDHVRHVLSNDCRNVVRGAIRKDLEDRITVRVTIDVKEP